MVESSEEIINMPTTSLDTIADNIEHKLINVEQTLEQKIILCVANSSAIFKSQQIDEPELTVEEKKIITSDLLYKSHSQFLSRFGKYLTIDLLEYFTTNNDKYEVIHYVNQLKRYFNSRTRQLDRKNRRYEALKALIDKGEYFSETSMMKRNPLLYDNLIGRYLTEEQRKARDNLDTTNITFVNLLLESIERDHIKRLKKNQEDEEDDVLEENDSDSDTDNEICINSEKIDGNILAWGEISNVETSCKIEEKGKELIIPVNNITTNEKNMLRQEFITQMYQNFLDGKDIDFDYSLVDDNEAYDNVDLRAQDEEEKYFDSETPEWIDEPQLTIEQDESEDELDKYMKCLKEQSHTNQHHLRESPT